MSLDYYGGFPEHAQILLHMRNRKAAGDLTPAQAAVLDRYMQSEYLRKVMVFSHFQWYYVDEMDPNGPQSFRVFVDKAIQAVLSHAKHPEG